MTLATLITDAADDPSKLNAIIAEIEGGSLDSDNPTRYPAPTFDAATTGTWCIPPRLPSARLNHLTAWFFFAVCWVQ